MEVYVAYYDTDSSDMLLMDSFDNTMPSPLYKMLSGVCPDEQCQASLQFPAYDSSIECTNCGQRHNKDRIRDVKPITDSRVALTNLLTNLLLGKYKPKKGTDSVKVLGLSNYQCKILSPFLTRYGMDKTTGKAVPLLDMQPPKEYFDCSVLCDRSFRLEAEHKDVTGYGRDRTGSMIYLKDTLQALEKFNKTQECILPIHADGDGHCLVHAISRALIGRELFWHALRENLKHHLQENLDKYQALFSDFVANTEWAQIIAECDPNFSPLDGDPMGLRNIHIFGLANVLKRPIILLDSLQGLQSSGDYSGLFLPGMCTPEDCSKGEVLNKPLCVAWSSGGHNHYLALVGIKDQNDLPRLPDWMIPKVWGMPQDQAKNYLQFDSDGSLAITGNKCLSDKYILRLVEAMEQVFYDSYKVSTGLVADVHQYIFRSTGHVGVKPEIVLEHTQRAMEAKQLYRCLMCDALTEWVADNLWFRPGGLLYKIAVDTYKNLDPSKLYSFPMHGYICSYDDEKDELIPDKEKSQPSKCQFCQGTSMRPVSGDGTIHYVNGDRTKSRSDKCDCGYKHYWDGQEYDQIPEEISLQLDWGGQSIADKVVWFENESDPSLNSNVFEVAQGLVQKHYPGEFGSERLVQKVVDLILRQTARKAEESDTPPLPVAGTSSGDELDASWRSDMASKIILSGSQRKSLHKEDLNKSTTEVETLKRVQAKAPQMQKRKTDELAALSKASSGGSSKTGGGIPKQPASPTKQSPKQARTTSESLDTSATTPPGDSAPKQNKVRVTTSDGRQMTLTLEDHMTYSRLQQTLEEQLGVPGDRQTIKHGFPPKVLMPPPHDSKDELLDLKHGDKLTVEIAPEPVKDEFPEISTFEASSVWPAPEPQRQNWSGFDPDAHDQSAQSMLSSLESLQSANQDSLDTSIASLTLMATLMGKDLWTYVQGMPHLFSVGGLYYKLFERDVGLADGKHCTLSTLHGKVFRYNCTDDRLELCLEPYGHFPIEPGLERRILQGEVTARESPSRTDPAVTDALSTGSSGVLVNKAMKLPSHATPFSGHGHSLLSGTENIHMPQDIGHTTHHTKARTFKQLSNHNPQAIQEEDESKEAPARTASVSMATVTKEPKFHRIGPGVTVLSQESADSDPGDTSSQSDMFRKLASQIATIVRETEDMDNDSDTNLSRMDAQESNPTVSESATHITCVSESTTNRVAEMDTRILLSKEQSERTTERMEVVSTGTGEVVSTGTGDGDSCRLAAETDKQNLDRLKQLEQVELHISEDEASTAPISDVTQPSDTAPDSTPKPEPMDST